MPRRTSLIFEGCSFGPALRRVRQFEDENRRLKTLIADLTLDKHMLQEVLRKKF